jgi:hypothetical protein
MMKKNGGSKIAGLTIPFHFCSIFFGLLGLLLLIGNVKSSNALAADIEPKETPPAEAQVPQMDWQAISEHLILVAQLDGNFSLTDQAGGDRVSGGGLNAVISPAYRFSDTNLFVLMYTGTYYKKLDFYSDLVGPRERTEFQSHTITPTLKLDFGKDRRYSVIPSFFFTRTYNKDVEGGGWGDGLYNYKDIGGGLDFKIRGLGYKGEEGELRFGGQYYERTYPNYASLLDLATGNAIERDERDYDGLLARGGYRWGDAIGLAWSADYFFLRKELEGKKVVDSNGFLTGEGQDDYQHNFDLRFSYVPDTQPGLRFGLDLNGSLYRSNQNYYDGRGTLTLADDVPIPDYYDYDSYTIRPSVSYLLPMIPLTPTLSYAYQKTDYTNRPAQNSNGTYKHETQEETQNSISFDLRYGFTERVSIYGRFQYLNVSSNNDDESVYSYNHELYSYYAGLSLRY